MSGQEVVVTVIPLCDYCKQFGINRLAVVDGKTHVGLWANMCEPDFKAHGVGLGLGKGQRLVLQT